MPRYSFDGEKIPSQDLERVFKMPPGIDGFPRSTLIVGSQGAGKTVLLRRAKADAGPGGVYVNLYTALNSLTEELGRGGLHLEYSDEIEKALRNKSAAIILAAVLAGLESVKLPFQASLVDPVVPASRQSSRNLTSYTDYFYRIARTRLLEFSGHANTDVLLGSLRHLQDVLGAPLTICLDRADSIPWPATFPLFSLLDQSQSCLTLVATRPGISASVAASQATTHAGPQYDLVQLGASPYDEEWTEFTRQAVMDYYSAGDRPLVPADLIEQATSLGRESFRLVLQLLHFRATTATWAEKFQERARLSQSLLEKAACTTLAAASVDFRHLLSLARLHAAKRTSRRPVLVSIVEPDGRLWVDRRTRAFVELALRESALVMPPGETWYPGHTPLKLEIPPIFVAEFEE